MTCEECNEQPDETKEFFGCPFHGFAGSAHGPAQHVELDPPWDRSCPQWFFTMPWVQRVIEDLDDYRRGALGNVRDLPAIHLDLLRVADAEQARWERTFHDIIKAKVKARGRRD